MPTPFGPQLIGETEKTLGALLRNGLDGTGLTEPQWVSLRLASQLDGTVDHDGLVAAIADRAHFVDATDLVDELTARGLIAAGRLTADGSQRLESLLTKFGARTAPIWQDLPADDVDAATRLLNEVISRARRVMADRG